VSVQGRYLKASVVIANKNGHSSMSEALEYEAVFVKQSIRKSKKQSSVM